ncbi:hypothetical protein FRC08_008763 [Ceratobasidium sp. 394]|nr:hypothetical protein FRC08_008763 [Ceratobasidium sp. 394]
MKSRTCIFALPELLKTVLEQCATPRVVVNLGSTSRYMFDSCIPFAWRHVPSEFRLFDLLPRVKMHQHPSGGEYLCIELPGPLTDKEMSRFHLYASFVKSLDIFSLDECYWKLLNYNWLLSYSRSRALLPNLQTLTWINEIEPLHYQAIAIRIGLFLSPSLLNFELPVERNIYPLTLRPSAAWLVLRTIADTCPKLRSLAIFPYYPEEFDPDDEDAPEEDESCEDVSTLLRAQAPDVKFHDLSIPFSQISGLTALKTNQWVLKLFPLGGLSHLESLDVDMWWTPYKAQLPYTLFPSLKHLGLFRCKERDILRLFPTSSTTLTSFRLHFSPRGDPVPKIISRLAEYFPHLADLSIRPHIEGPDYKMPIIEPVVLKPLANLVHLQRLHLLDISIAPENADATRVFSHISVLLPNFKVLEVPYMPITLSQLRGMLAHVPKIQYLDMDIAELGCVGKLDAGRQARAVGLHTLKAFGQDIFSFIQRTGKDKEEEVAQYLFALCPNVQIYSQDPHKSYCSPWDQCMAAKDITASINKRLSVLAAQTFTN